VLRVSNNLSQIVRDLGTWGARLTLRELVPVTEKAGREIVKIIRFRMSIGRDVQGRPFHPLAPATLAARARRRTGTKILIETRTLYKAIRSRATERSVLIDIDPSSPAAKYWKAHHTGVRPWLPQRQFIPTLTGIQPLYLAPLTREFNKYLEKVIK
jgi:hypothetical protein